MPTKKTTKKSAKKATKETKKAASSRKKAPGKKTAKKKLQLVNASNEHCFWVSDGEVLANLVDLGTAFEQMADDVFKHHVTKDKNDFAEWVEHVLEDKELAAAMRRSRKPKTARIVVVRRLRVYDA